MAVFCELAMNGMRGQIQSSIKDSTTALIVNEWKHNWNQPVITYRLNNYTSDWEKKKHQETALTVAFRTWQLKVKNIKFKRVYDPTKRVDINVSFQPLEKFDNKKGVLAHAYFPGQGELSGDIEINDEWNWVPHAKWQKLSNPPLLSILIHEIGHSLGLIHDTSTMKSMMYPSFDLGKPKHHLHQNDIDRIQERYGKREISKRIIDYFMGRDSKGIDFR